MVRVKKIGWLGLALLVLGGTSLYLGRNFLGGGFLGGDDGHALFQIDYFYRYWPSRGLWQPSHGAGFSLYGINYSPFWVVAMTARILGWTPAQAMHFWQWFNMYLASLGVLALGWFLISPLVGLAAGFFFLLSQISWFWEARVGLFAFQMSFFLVPFFFLFLDRYFQSEKKGSLLEQRLFLILAGVFFGISIWFHLVTAVVMAGAGFFYALIGPLDKVSTWGWRMRGFLLSALIGLFFSLPWLMPFAYHNRQIFSGEIDYLAFKNLPAPDLGMFLGWGGYARYAQLDVWYGFFALPVLVLVFLGTIFSWIKKRKKVFVFSLMSFFCLFLACVKYYAPSLARDFFFFFSLTNIRFVLIPIIFFPLVAGFGVVALSKAVVSKIKNQFLNSALVFLLSGLIVFFLTWQLDRSPEGFWGLCGSSYGPDRLLDENCELSFREAMRRSLKYLVFPSKTGIPAEEDLADLAGKIPQIDNLRADLTTRRGESIQLWGKVSKVGILQSANRSRVIPIQYWNYQIDNFYNKRTEAKVVDEIAGWLGIDYVILEEGKGDPLDNFTNWSFWEKVREMEIRKSPFPVGLVTYSLRPTVLFIGDESQGAYFSWWQMLVNGGLSHKQAFLVNGGERVESFEAEELRGFDVLVLWGEEYKKTERADELVEGFLESGGRVLVDTGWQYTSPFWEKDDLPEWLPVKQTEWGIFDSWRLEGEKELISSWRAPKWDGQPWGASSAGLAELRPGALALVTDSDSKSLLAARMSYGKGEVIWTGLNLVALHQTGDQKGREVAEWFLTSLLPGEVEDFSFDFKREEPGRVELDLQPYSRPTWIYFRESFYPSWQVELREGEKGKIYKSGPGLMLVRVPAGVSKVVFSHKDHWPVLAGRLVFGLMFLGLGLALFGATRGKKHEEE